MNNILFLSSETDSSESVTHLKQIVPGFSVLRAPLTHIQSRQMFLSVCGSTLTAAETHFL